LEPFLKAISIDGERFGTFISPTENRIGFAVQADADDVMFVSTEIKRVQWTL
jgi:hypothetical protein